jgi:hypothetical protein
MSKKDLSFLKPAPPETFAEKLSKVRVYYEKDYEEPKIEILFKEDNQKSEERRDLFKEIEGRNFKTAVGDHFLRKKKEYFKLDGIAKEDRYKNRQIAFRYYKDFCDCTVRDMEIDLNGISEEIYFKKLKSIQFWKDIIDFMFTYADANTISWYSQTINGVFLFYFKKYKFLKTTMDRTKTSHSKEGEDRLILGAVRKWNAQQALDCFHLYIVKLYRHFRPNFEANIKTNYYIYTKFFNPLSTKVPSLRKEAFLGSGHLRGFFICFKSKFRYWIEEIENKKLEDVFNYKELEDMCEEHGADIIEEPINKSLDEIVEEALLKYLVIKE